MSEETAIKGLYESLKESEKLIKEPTEKLLQIMKWMDDNLTEEQKFKFAMDAWNPFE